MTLRWVPGWNGLTEPEAVSYVAAVEAADGQDLEFGVARAINDFVVGCKNDGIWDAIKACCILAGARTLSGALVPLVGNAPTNYNFVSGDYNRETGLKGDGSTKYLGSNRAGNADPLNDAHLSVYAYTASSSGEFKQYIAAVGPVPGPTKNLAYDTSASFGTYGYINSTTSAGNASTQNTGFIGISRASSATIDFRAGGSTSTVSNTSTGAPTGNINVFAVEFNPVEGPLYYADARLAFYSIGESLDLEKLDNRVTRLMNLISYTQAAGLPDLSTMDLDAAAYIGGGYRAGGTLS